MMSEKVDQDPSMEEILASIRQIIAADSQERPSPEASSEDILDLTQFLPDEQEPMPLSTEASLNDFEKMEMLQNDLSFQGHNINQYNTVEPLSSPHDSLLAQTTVSQTTEAFHLLHKVTQTHTAPQSGQQQTLDQLVRDMLQPLLKEWLDANLPDLVHSLVAQQIERITNQQGSNFSSK